MTQGQTGGDRSASRRRPGPSIASRTFSAGSFYADAPIPTLAGIRRVSTLRYQRCGSDSGSYLEQDSDSNEGQNHRCRITPLPVRQLLLLAFLSLSEQNALNSISPYLPQMVASMPGIPLDWNGLYVGILASAFALAQLSNNFLWGYASDLVGRKPILLAGTSCLAACFTVFGFCRRYWHDVVAHVAMGLLNGNAACVPSVLGELTDRSNQSKAFTFLPIIYSLGAISGPALGGLLVGRIDGIQYPYLAPNVFATAFLAVSVIVIAIWFEEIMDDESDAGPWKPLWIARLSCWLREKTHFSANRRSSWSVRWLDNGQVESQQRTQRQPLLSPTCSTSSSTSPLSSCSPDNANSDSVCN